MLIISIILLIIILFILYFYRLPYINLSNIKQLDPKIILSPAYGQIQNIYQNNNQIIIAIALTIFDIHAQYIPSSGQIIDQIYTLGLFKMLGPKMDKNERNSITIKTKYGLIEVIQYAGYFTRRISSFINVRDSVKRGQLYGFISLGSRVDIILPKNKVKINVKIRDRLKGSESIVGRWI